MYRAASGTGEIVGMAYGMGGTEVEIITCAMGGMIDGVGIMDW